MLRYAITDRALFGGDLDAMLAHLASIAPEIDSLQLRERNLPAAVLEPFACRLMQVLAALPRRPRVLINHRADVAIACGADGVHLRSGAGELSPAQLRQLYRAAHLPEPVVSVSCHTLGEVEAVREADLILFGPVFEKPLPSPELPLPGTGLALLADACHAAHSTPVFALGGVTEENQQLCGKAGASGVAGIRRFMRD
jgi:thiamine-phosphate pyrophosphorylase